MAISYKKLWGTLYFCQNHLIQIIAPLVISTKIFGVSLKTAFGVPAAAYIFLYCKIPDYGD
jgi:hypothetical protein